MINLIEMSIGIGSEMMRIAPQIRIVNADQKMQRSIAVAEVNVCAGCANVTNERILKSNTPAHIVNAIISHVNAQKVCCVEVWIMENVIVAFANVNQDGKDPVAFAVPKKICASIKKLMKFAPAEAIVYATNVSATKRKKAVSRGNNAKGAHRVINVVKI